jgi:hypothetical protein
MKDRILKVKAPGNSEGFLVLMILNNLILQ